MRLLYLTDDIPNRDPVVGDGSSMISYEVLLALDPAIEVTLLTFELEFDVPAEVADRCADVVLLSPRQGPEVALRTLLGREDFNGSARTTTAAGETVRRLSAAADVTLLHGPQLTWHARRVVGPMVLQSVDPWSLAVRGALARTQGLRRAFRAHKARQAEANERRLPARARLLTVGAADARQWSQRLGRPVRSIANGVDQPTGGVRAARPPGPPTLVFTGTLVYAPNIASASLLVGEVLPRVRASRPEVRVVLAGRRPTPEVLALAGDGVEVRANVPAMAEVYAEADVAVFPDDAGLGIRNSVTEALAAGVPVVASPIAAREQPPHPLLHVEDGTAAIAERVLRVLEERATAGSEDDGNHAPPPSRSWAEATADYEQELRAARA